MVRYDLAISLSVFITIHGCMKFHIKSICSHVEESLTDKYYSHLYYREDSRCLFCVLSSLLGELVCAPFLPRHVANVA